MMVAAVVHFHVVRTSHIVALGGPRQTVVEHKFQPQNLVVL